MVSFEKDFNMNRKRNSVQYILVIAVTAIVTAPVLSLPLGIMNNILPSTMVRNAYAHTGRVPDTVRVAESLAD